MHLIPLLHTKPLWKLLPFYTESSDILCCSKIRQVEAEKKTVFPTSRKSQNPFPSPPSYSLLCPSSSLPQAKSFRSVNDLPRHLPPPNQWENLKSRGIKKEAIALSGRAAPSEGLEGGRWGARWETGGAEAMKERPDHIPAACSYLAAKGWHSWKGIWG